MNVIKADTLGYCMGVRRAVESAEVALKEYKDKKVYSLGPLIHNQNALDDLASKGLNIIDENSIDELKENSVVIIRAHGVKPSVKKILEDKNTVIIDATCPRVTVSQNRVKEFSRQGYTVFLTGDKGHAEVEGIKGFCESDFYCIENLSEAQDVLKTNTFEKVMLLSQTTFSEVEFAKISEYFKTFFDAKKGDDKIQLVIINTICPATKQRQEALEKLSGKVKGIIVVGGKKSANTVRLYQKASSYVKKAVHIENASEIPDEFYLLDTVGITAGASTPDSVIDEVVERLTK
ncbi:MAG: 4-hydroxy-3-methylbut-2-enyl diphosphate reductase [Treponema sp.]|uniref:4-hydroxy-3-methylbut-2-enyl diphosphate reductase n=1 Tax=Treponema sp. TaxID=166 RepID=UPI00298D8927|nr:4-hydroxy-3-methylbut-2-enyl diphosphate reductase [Treponema sp.]MCR5386536.1 4-hydroxy-3-methylbut-2-enyl diphosphate reductase [Treponema sp.]